MPTIAFLGTGTMGLPMARNLARAGNSIRAWNRTAERAEPLRADGAEVFERPADAVHGAQVAITMLSDADTVLDTVSDAFAGASPDLTWVQMSTIGLEGTTRCREFAQERGIEFVDAPVLGTKQPAEEGKLVVLASGPQQRLQELAPVFEALGRTLQVGEAGEGTRLKLVVNSWVLGVTGLIAETISLARSLDIDPRHFFDAVEGGTLDLPYARLKGGAMIEGEFQPAAFRLALARKDADLVVAAAEGEQLEVPVLEAVAERLRRAQDAGHGDDDMAANYLATADG